MKSNETVVDGLTKGMFEKNKAVYVKGWDKITNKHETKLKKLNNPNKTEKVSGIDMEGRQVLIIYHWQSTTHPHIYAIGNADKGSIVVSKFVLARVRYK